MILDLSENNTVTSWDAIKRDYAGVILRCAYRGYRYNTIKEDSRFKEYARACIENNIPIGIYFMSQAINENEAIEEARYTLNAALNVGATLPLYIDSEWSHNTHDGRADFLSREERTKVVKEFCDTINENGFIGGVYACESWFSEHLIYDEVRKYNVWVADFGKNTGEITSSIQLPKYDLWQFTSNRKVEGIVKPVDCSVYPNELPSPEPIQLTRTITGMPVIRKGSKGKAVQIWQIIVGTNPDGVFGDLTEAATRKFQTNCKIQIDGVVGPESWLYGINSF